MSSSSIFFSCLLDFTSASQLAIVIAHAVIEILCYSHVYAVICVTVALQPRGLMDGELGEVAVPAGIEIILIGAYKLALDISNAVVQIQVGDDSVPTADSADVSMLLAKGVDAFAGKGEVLVRAQVRRRKAEQQQEEDQIRHCV